MAAAIMGIVEQGRIVPSSPLPEGARVEIRICEAAPDVPLELQEELEAWQRAGANALALVEELVVESDANEKR